MITNREAQDDPFLEGSNASFPQGVQNMGDTGFKNGEIISERPNWSG